MKMIPEMGVDIGLKKYVFEFEIKRNGMWRSESCEADSIGEATLIMKDPQYGVLEEGKFIKATPCEEHYKNVIWN